MKLSIIGVEPTPGRSSCFVVSSGGHLTETDWEMERLKQQLNDLERFTAQAQRHILDVIEPACRDERTWLFVRSRLLKVFGRDGLTGMIQSLQQEMDITDGHGEQHGKEKI